MSSKANSPAEPSATSAATSASPSPVPARSGRPRSSPSANAWSPPNPGSHRMGLLDTIRRRIGMTEKTAAGSMADQGMAVTNAYGPGAPLQPSAGLAAQPRSRDYQSGYNI